MIDLKELIKTGVYFGHQRSRWSPKMAPYIWGHRSGIHLIDVSKTALNLDKAAAFLKGLAEQKKPILWVGTKQAAQLVVTEIATKLEMPFITHRWVGGLITNFPQVKKSVTKYLHNEDILVKSEDYNYTKKELSKLQKNTDKMKKTIGGIRTLTWPIGAIVVVDAKKEETAIREAAQAGVPVVALVDTNSDPSLVTYVIPGNDDSPKSIRIIMEYLANAVAEGKAKAAQNRAEGLSSKSDEAADVIHGMKELESEDSQDEAGRKKPRRPVARPVARKVVKKVDAPE